MPSEIQWDGKEDWEECQEELTKAKARIKELEKKVKVAEEFIIQLGHEDNYRLWSFKKKSVSEILPHANTPLDKDKEEPKGSINEAVRKSGHWKEIDMETGEPKEPVEGEVYHWTDTKTAKKILKDGLRRWSFVSRRPQDWNGEVCLAIKYEVDWENRNTDASWQAIVKEYIPPEKIRLYVDLEPDDKGDEEKGIPPAPGYNPTEDMEAEDRGPPDEGEED